jgi:hypothetical protein
MNTSQLLNFTVQDSSLGISPGSPATGIWGNLTDIATHDPIIAIVISLGAALLIIGLIALFVHRKNRHSTRSRLLKSGLLTGLLIATIVAPVLAASATAPTTINLTIDKAAVTTATVTTSLSLDNDQTDPYEVAATLDPAKTSSQFGSDIALELAGQTITLEPDSIVTVHEGTTTGAINFDLGIAVTITDNLPVGTYQAAINYGVTYTPPAPTTMQAMTADYCENYMAVYTNNNDDDKLLTLTDTRDGQQYLVGKLADTNCWMLNNLKLGSDHPITLTPDDTDIDANWTLPQVDNSTNGEDQINPHVFAFTSDQTYYDADKPNADETDIASPNFAGYAYNWPAATAGASQLTVPTWDIAPHSICPKNWRLPTGGWYADEDVDSLNKDFFKLYSAYDDDDDHDDYDDYAAFQFNGPFRGVFAPIYSAHFGLWLGAGYYTYLWSSVSSYGDDAFTLKLTSDSVYPRSDWRGYYGLSARCLLRPIQ